MNLNILPEMFDGEFTRPNDDNNKFSVRMNCLEGQKIVFSKGCMSAHVPLTRWERIRAKFSDFIRAWDDMMNEDIGSGKIDEFLDKDINLSTVQRLLNKEMGE